MSFNDDPKVTGAGPWSFSPDEPLEVGEPWRLNFRTMTHRGQPRYFNRYLPLDDLVVTNRDTAAVLEVTVNDQFDTLVEPSQTRSWDKAGVATVEILNRSSNPAAVDPGAINVEVSTEGVTADTAARREATQSPIGKVVENVTGLDPFGGWR